MNDLAGIRARYREPHFLFGPVSAAALLVLIMNDHFLKSAFAGSNLGMLTGKLSDFAGAILLAGALTFTLRVFASIGLSRAALLAAILSCILLSMIEASPLAIEIYETVFSLFMPMTGLNGVSRLTADISDLWALPLTFVPLMFTYFTTRDVAVIRD